ncbi:hypothetical protein K9L27_01875 [Candidatus Gracilibacteria bacterium]|nr:hypothetical protein [Candidatus Gracilibacteria bacterium]
MKTTLFGLGMFLLVATIGGYVLTSRAQVSDAVEVTETLVQSACVRGGQCGCSSVGQCGQSQCTGQGSACGGVCGEK